jgi:hypothetical protein
MVNEKLYSLSPSPSLFNTTHSNEYNFLNYTSFTIVLVKKIAHRVRCNFLCASSLTVHKIFSHSRECLIVCERHKLGNSKNNNNNTTITQSKFCVLPPYVGGCVCVRICVSLLKMTNIVFL